MRILITYFKTISLYYNVQIQCKGKEGHSVKFRQKGCLKSLNFREISVWGEEIKKEEEDDEILICYDSKHRCGKFSMFSCIVVNVMWSPFCTCRYNNSDIVIYQLHYYAGKCSFN